MCCGSKRLDAARDAAPAHGRAAQRAPHKAAPSGAAPSGDAAARAAAAVAGGSIFFINDGPGELIVTGAFTGRRYCFAGRGARLAVDRLDAPALALVEKLRRLA